MKGWKREEGVEGGEDAQTRCQILKMKMSLTGCKGNTDKLHEGGRWVVLWTFNLTHFSIKPATKDNHSQPIIDKKHNILKCSIKDELLGHCLEHPPFLPSFLLLPPFSNVYYITWAEVSRGEEKAWYKEQTQWAQGRSRKTDTCRQA